MKAPYYSRPVEFKAEGHPRFHTRYQIVIPAYDEAQAARLSRKVSEICGHDVERIIGVTDDGSGRNLGDVVIERITFGLQEHMISHQEAMLDSLGLNNPNEAA